MLRKFYFILFFNIIATYFISIHALSFYKDASSLISLNEIEENEKEVHKFDFKKQQNNHEYLEYCHTSSKRFIYQFNSNYFYSIIESKYSKNIFSPPDFC